MSSDQPETFVKEYPVLSRAAGFVVDKLTTFGCSVCFAQPVREALSHAFGRHCLARAGDQPQAALFPLEVHVFSEGKLQPLIAEAFRAANAPVPWHINGLSLQLKVNRHDFEWRCLLQSDGRVTT
jgi:hypothetical protein